MYRLSNDSDYVTIYGKEEEIKSCPFCGQLGSGIYESDWSEYENPHYKALNRVVVYCTNCGANVWEDIRGYLSARDVAWKKWQHRSNS